VGVIFSVAHTDMSCTNRLSSVCLHVVSHLTTAVRTVDSGGKMAEQA